MENQDPKEASSALSADKSAALSVQKLLEQARAYAEGSRQPATIRAYTGDLARFADFCRTHGLSALPATGESVALYLTARAKAGKSVATIERELSAIAQAHRRAKCNSPRDSPLVQEVMGGIRRKHRKRPKKQARPLLPDDIRAMVKHLPDDMSGLRDRALLCLGFAGAFRRSELVALCVEDLTFVDDGLRVFVEHSKTDQEGAGSTVGIPFGRRQTTCPVRTVKRWLEAAGIERGSIFRTVRRGGSIGGLLQGRDVSRIVKRAAERAGMDATDLSGHSLRSGLATAAAAEGKSDHMIMRQGRWSSRSTLDRYVRDARIFEDNAAEGIGL